MIQPLLIFFSITYLFLFTLYILFMYYNIRIGIVKDIKPNHKKMLIFSTSEL